MHVHAAIQHSGGAYDSTCSLLALFTGNNSKWAIPLKNYTPLLMTKNVVQRGSNGNVLGGCSIAVRCVQRGFNGNVLGGVLHQDVSRGGLMVMS